MTGQIRVPPEGEPAGSTGGGVQVDEATGDADAGATVAVGAEELALLRSQLEERTGDLQRITAEYSNYRRRVERDRQLTAAAAKAQVAGELLTVLDDIERAGAHGDLSGAFKVVADRLVAGLAAQGLESFGGTGDEFDPDVHEAVQHSTSPEVQGPTVTAVLRRGYRFGERVLRPAMVVVTDAEPGPVPGSGTAGAAEEISRDAARSGPEAQSVGDSAGPPESGGSAESAGSGPGQGH